MAIWNMVCQAVAEMSHSPTRVAQSQATGLGQAAWQACGLGAPVVWDVWPDVGGFHLSLVPIGHLSAPFVVSVQEFGRLEAFECRELICQPVWTDLGVHPDVSAAKPPVSGCG